MNDITEFTQDQSFFVNYQTFGSIDEMLAVHVLKIFEKCKAEINNGTVLDIISADAVFQTVNESIRMSLAYLVEFYLLNYPDTDTTLLFLNEVYANIFPLVRSYFPDSDLTASNYTVTSSELSNYKPAQRALIKNFLIQGEVFIDGNISTIWCRGLLNPNFSKIIKSPAFKKTLFFLQNQSIYTIEDLNDCLNLWLLRHKTVQTSIADAMRSMLVITVINPKRARKSLKIIDLLKEVQI